MVEYETISKISDKIVSYFNISKNSVEAEQSTMQNVETSPDNTRKFRLLSDFPISRLIWTPFWDNVHLFLLTLSILNISKI